MDKHPNLFTYIDFENASFEKQKEVFLFWKDYGQPSACPFWMERLITAIEHGAPLVIPRYTFKAANDFYWKLHEERKLTLTKPLN
jgi:hypothetical protein